MCAKCAKYHHRCHLCINGHLPGVSQFPSVFFIHLTLGISGADFFMGWMPFLSLDQHWTQMGKTQTGLTVSSVSTGLWRRMFLPLCWLMHASNLHVYLRYSMCKEWKKKHEEKKLDCITTAQNITWFFEQRHCRITVKRKNYDANTATVTYLATGFHTDIFGHQQIISAVSSRSIQILQSFPG